MTASERLKALAAEAERPGETFHAGAELDALVRNALPQIVAVVEAAEKWDRMWTEDYDSNWEETHAALAALEKALVRGG